MGSKQDKQAQPLNQNSLSESQSQKKLYDWLKDDLKFDQDQLYNVYKLCQSLKTVSDDKIQTIIHNQSSKEVINNKDVQGVKEMQLDIILDEIENNSNLSKDIVDFLSLSGFFKKYLQQYKKIETSFISTHLLQKEINEFRQDFPEVSPSDLKQEIQNQDGQANAGDPQLTIESEHQNDEVQYNMESPKSQEEQNNNKKLINDYKEMLQEFKQRNLYSNDDLRQELNQLKQRIAFFDSILDIQNNEASVEKETESDDISLAKQIPPGLQKRREKGLSELFKFYCRQHVLKGKKMNFEDMEKESNTMNLGEFYKFCSDFQISLHKIELSEIYRKKLRNNEPLVYDNFKKCLEAIFSRLREKKIEQNNKEQDIIDAQIQQQDLSSSTLFQLKEKKAKLQKELKSIKKQNDFMELAHEYLETSDPQKYGKKMKGFQIPFGCNGEKLEQMTGITQSIKSNLNILGLRASIEQTKDTKDVSRDRIREESLSRIHQIRSLNSEKTSVSVGKTYSLAQLRKIKNSRELYLKDNEMQTILGINNDNIIEEPILVQLQKKDSYSYQQSKMLQNKKHNKNASNFKTPQKTHQHQQQSLEQKHSRNQSQPQQKDYYQDRNVIQKPSDQSIKKPQALNYHSKIMNRANQLEKLDQSIDYERRQKAIDAHLNRDKMQKQLIDNYSENERFKKNNSVLRPTH